MKLHSERGREVASQLFEAFQNSGIHGQKEMPEDTPPAGVEESSLEHLLFITLTVSIDYQREPPWGQTYTFDIIAYSTQFTQM